MNEKQLIKNLTKANEIMDHLIKTGASGEAKERQQRLINQLEAKKADRKF